MGEDGEPVYGSYTVVNHWPQKLSEQRTLYLNQFTGQTITNSRAAQDGALSRLSSWSVDMHMGNQYGLLTRTLCDPGVPRPAHHDHHGVIMWWKRRPTGSSGLPGRASDKSGVGTPRRAAVAVGVIGTVLAVVYPAFGVTLLLVIGAEVLLAATRGRRSLVSLPDR